MNDSSASEVIAKSRLIRRIVWTVATSATLILTFLARAPSLYEDYAKMRNIDTEEGLRKSAAEPYLNLIAREALQPQQSTPKSARKSITITGRPLIIDRDNRKLSDYHHAIARWAKPLRDDEPLTLIVIANRTPVMFPDWFTSISGGKRITGFGEKADLFLVAYPQGGLFGHFEIIANPPIMTIEKESAVAGGMKGKTESALPSWYKEVFDEDLDLVLEREGMTPPLADVEGKHIKSPLLSFLSVMDSPLEHEIKAPTWDVFIFRHIGKFTSAFIVVGAPIFGASYFLLFVVDPYRKPRRKLGIHD